MTWLLHLSENEVKEQAADGNVLFDQWGQREESEGRQAFTTSYCRPGLATEPGVLRAT